MLFNIEKGTLAKPLSQLARLADKATSASILNQLKIVLNGDKLQLTASDWSVETTWTSRVNGQGGECLVSAERLSRAVNSLPNGALVGFELKDNILTISAARVRYRLPALPVGQFPLMKPPKDSTEPFALLNGELHSIIDDVAIAASDADHRPFLLGVWLKSYGSTLIARASDAYSLAQSKYQIEDLPQIDCLIAKATLQKIKPFLGDSVAVQIDGDKVRIQSLAFDIVTATLNSEFPPFFETVLDPKDTDETVKTASSIFGECLKRASLFVGGTANAVELKIQDGQASIKPVTTDGGDSTETLVVEHNSDVHIGVNAKAVEKLLTRFDGRIDLAFNPTDNRRPMLITGDNPNYTAGAMLCKV